MVRSLLYNNYINMFKLYNRLKLNTTIYLKMFGPCTLMYERTWTKHQKSEARKPSPT